MASRGTCEEDFFSDSDTDSLFDPNSPSDGYFSPRDHPQQNFVQNSSVQAESETKARDAAVASARRTSSSAATPPSHTSPTLSNRSAVWADESTPILDAGPAPPDYAAATADRRAPQSAPQASQAPTQPDYGSIERPAPRQEHDTDESEVPWPFGSRGNPFGPHAQWPLDQRDNPFRPHAQWPLGQRDNPFGPDFPFGRNGRQRSQVLPESMMDRQTNEPTPGPDGEGSTRYPYISHRRRKLRRYCGGTRTLMLALAIIVAVLVLLLVGLWWHSSTKREPTHHDLEAPLPGNNSGSDNKNTPLSGRCANAVYSEVVHVSFPDGSNFHLNEHLGRSKAFATTGAINFLPASSGQDSDIRISVTYATTDQWVLRGLSLMREETGIEFSLRDEQTRSSATPCLDLMIDIHIKPELVIDVWNITTSNLDIMSTKGMFTHHASDPSSSHPVPGLTEMSTGKGTIDLASWYSRETRIHSHSGKISGTYGLQDLLSISTYSGAINIEVEPQGASPTKPAPAVFEASSRSGDVEVVFARDRFFPDRDYQAHVTTQSGAIRGSYLLGSTANFQSTSGQIAADVLPFNAIRPSHLITQTTSSSAKLKVWWPYRGEGEPLRLMQSEHTSTSGALDLIYPGEWEGMIKGSTRSGNIDVRGKDVESYYSGIGPDMGKQYVGHKGYGESKVHFKTTSGNVNLRVGEVGTTARA